MKAITSASEKLEEGVNFFTHEQTSWNGIKWTSYNATIGAMKVSCPSLESLQNAVDSHDFGYVVDRELRARAIEQFGTNA